MNNPEAVISEQCGTLGRTVNYSINRANNKVVRLSSSETYTNKFIDRIRDLFREIFLPHGYPDSVSEDYLDYQIWDTVQAFCSTITGTFTTQAILKSVGVGNAQATPFAAALTWIMKDGTGMIGRVVFAWWKGNSLDGDCKKWRLCADILNDTAMFLELLVPYFNTFSLQVLCITTSMKAVVGVAGGATRASITQHQAIQGNMADVSAKDSSQETFVNLIASFVGIILLAVFTDWHQEWAVFVLFTIIHLVANYFAVCSLNVPHLNTARLLLVLRTYLKFDAVPNPLIVNKKESVIIGFGEDVKDICGFHINVGKSLKNLPTAVTPYEMNNIVEIYNNSKYALIPHIKNRTIDVTLKKGDTSEDIIMAYFHAVLLGIATCYYNHVPLSIDSKRQLHHVTAIMRLYSVLKPYKKSVVNREEQLPLDVLRYFNETAQQEISMFFTALKINGWNLSTHSIEVGEWRASWRNNVQVAGRAKLE